MFETYITTIYLSSSNPISIIIFYAKCCNISWSTVKTFKVYLKYYDFFLLILAEYHYSSKIPTGNKYTCSYLYLLFIQLDIFPLEFTLKEENNKVLRWDM